MASKRTMTIKTLQKWEEELISEFSYDLNSDKVVVYNVTIALNGNNK